MEFSEDDPEEEVMLKTQVLEHYNARLDERIRRKKFVIERGLLDIRKLQKQQKRLSKEERDIVNGMKPFARFQSKEEHEKLVSGLLKEYHLRILIQQLKHYQGLGLHTLSQIDNYIKDQQSKGNRSQKDKEKDAIVQKHIRESSKSKEVGERLSSRIPNIKSKIAESKEFANLNEAEKEFCIQVSLFPKDYLEIKKRMVSSHARNAANIEKIVKN